MCHHDRRGREDRRGTADGKMKWRVRRKRNEPVASVGSEYREMPFRRVESEVMAYNRMRLGEIDRQNFCQFERMCYLCPGKKGIQ